MPPKLPLPILWGPKGVEILLRSQASPFFNRNFEVPEKIQLTAEVVGWDFYHRAEYADVAAANFYAVGDTVEYTVPAGGKSNWILDLSLTTPSTGLDADAYAIAYIQRPQDLRKHFFPFQMFMAKGKPVLGTPVNRVLPPSTKIGWMFLGPTSTVLTPTNIACVDFISL